MIKLEHHLTSYLSFLFLGFAGTIRELPPHQLPEGWNTNIENGTSLTYKHRLKTGKQFLLSITVLMDGQLLAVSLTEQGGATYGTELNLSEFPDENLLKIRMNGLTRQLIPQLDKDKQQQQTVEQSSGCDTGLLLPPTPTPLFGAGSSSGAMSDSHPMIPTVGGGDLHPTFPGIPMRPDGNAPMRPDAGSGSEMGPSHPIFGGDPYSGGSNGNGGSGGNLGPIVPGWMPGLPRPRFDPFGPVPGPTGPNMGNPGFFGPGGGFLGGGGNVGPGMGGFGPGGFPGVMGGMGGGYGPLGGPGLGPGLGPMGPGGPLGPLGGGPLGPLGGPRGPPAGRGGRGTVPGEPNPDHLRPPQDDRNDFT